jgi:adenine specific DNA methylase Mod
MAEERTRIIYYGDNLDILRAHVAPESVDLVYLDPPFKSQQQYNYLFRTVKGAPADAQVRAFTDTWKWGPKAVETYDWLMEDPLVAGNVSQMVSAFHGFLGPSEMLAYLVMMTPCLLELHRVLKDTGSLYLHCDPAASHYLKLVMDTVFGPANFRSEIVWKRGIAHSDAGRPGAIHEILFLYSKSDRYLWNRQFMPYDSQYVQKYYRYKDEDGRIFLSDNLAAPGGRGPRYEWKGIVRNWRVTRENMD